MDVKKVTVATIVILLFLWMFSGNVHATDEQGGNGNGSLDELTEQYQALLQESGAAQLEAEIPEEARDLLKDNGITMEDSKTLLNIGFFDFVSNIINVIKNSATKPLFVFTTATGIILLCALLNSLKTGFGNGAYHQAFTAMSVVCAAGAAIAPIAELIKRSSLVLKEVSSYMMSFVPVYVGIITATGKPAAAVTYQISLITVIQFVSRVASTVLVPLLAIYLAFCLIGSACTQLNISGITHGVKTTVTVALGFMLTIFVGLLTVQGVVASSADTIAMKTGRFALSTFLPVVGSAMSDALSSIQGCMGLLKSTVGGFSIFVLVAAFLPSVVTVALMQLALSGAAAVGDLLNVDGIGTLLKAAGSVLSILLGIMLTFFALLTISAGVMLTLVNV